MSLKPASPEALQLLMEGSKAMSRMSATGLRIDTAYLKDSIEKTKIRIATMQREMRESEEMKVWMKHYGSNLTMGSRVQLGRVIFDILGHKRNPFLEGKNNVAAFEHLDLPFIRNYHGVERLKKALSTNLYGILRETVDGICHPFFDVTNVESYRSSSSKPNFHNPPTRNKEIAEIVRSCVIPRKDHVFIEADYSTQEVRVSYCYNKDPKLRYDILNGDMHTDRTKELYLLSDAELGPINKDPGKICRYTGKNKFVFAEFYGSYFGKCAPDLWDAISIFGLTTAQGLSIFEHLKKKGITKLGACNPEESPIPGTFEAHVQEVERRMWEESYPVYNQWKKDWWELYSRQGGIHTLTGFVLEGVFRRNQILCDPIQGSAFHCLLWSLIEVQKEFMRRKMKSRVVLQIHDSMLVDAHKSEVPDVVEIIKTIAVKKVMEHWKWITIPLSVEFEICESNWFKKVPYKEGMAA